jgi:hypothetical protein
VWAAIEVLRGKRLTACAGWFKIARGTGRAHNQKKVRMGSRDGRVEKAAFRARLPHQLVDETAGLGDVIKRVTSAAGITPCGGCEQRAAWLNRRFPLQRRGR